MLLHELVGHDRVVRALTQANASGTAHHAYLFQGPEGVGKRQAAFGFAALVNCVGDVAEPGRVACGKCRHCRRILTMAADPEATAHPDVLTLVPDGRQIKIAQVRDVLRMVPFPPIEARFRVVIVDPADVLGEEAANALLKTLEEPPSRTRFVLLTSRPAALLTTIKSRCQRMVFGRLPDEALIDLLVARHGWDRAQAERLAPVADGSVGAALALEGDPVMAARDEIMARFLGIAPGDTLEGLKLAAWISEHAGTRDTIINLLERLLRDALLVRLGVPQRLFHEDLRPQITAWAGRYGASALLARLEVLGETRRGLAVYNTNPRLTLERLLLALLAPPGAEGIQARVPTFGIL
ncbi:MAG: DNA polymerase III subunit delta' [Deltaproteobacteria bacterium]|nr:MAG: DNA polymerase III subunit delta' [Deltaproteobacteria bacterium]